MDGPDATRAIRALGYTGPILGVTGNTLDMDVQRFTECGCDFVMGKPFRLEEFVTHMDHHKTLTLTDNLHGSPSKSTDMAEVVGAAAAALIAVVGAGAGSGKHAGIGASRGSKFSLSGSITGARNLSRADSMSAPGYLQGAGTAVAASFSMASLFHRDPSVSGLPSRVPSMPTSREGSDRKLSNSREASAQRLDSKPSSHTLLHSRKPSYMGTQQAREPSPDPNSHPDAGPHPHPMMVMEVVSHLEADDDGLRYV
jgi:CheY-like chemotaxis protein